MRGLIQFHMKYDIPDIWALSLNVACRLYRKPINRFVHMVSIIPNDMIPKQGDYIA